MYKMFEIILKSYYSKDIYLVTYNIFIKYFLKIIKLLKDNKK